MQVEIGRLNEENRKLAHVNKICCEQLREQSGLFQKLKPTRLLLSSERKLYIAGEQLFRCNAPHGRDKCPRWLLNDGQFGPEGFEIHHEVEWSVSYQNAGVTVAICHSCHGLASRLHRMKIAESTGKELVEEDEEDL